MAQGAVMLMLFAFMMCLSCLSSSAIGSGVFYACSDGTMSPGDFDINKCTNFGFNDIIQGTGAVTGTSTTVDTSAATSVVTDGGLLVPGSADDEDPNATFLDFFSAGRNQSLSGLSVLAAATSKTDCAKICYNDEVPMRGASDVCNGFVSDGFSRCLLYPSNDPVSGGSLESGDKSYSLKRPKDGGSSFNLFKSVQKETAYRLDGGTLQFAGQHDVNCVDTNQNGLMTNFSFNPRGTHVNVDYTCLFSDTLNLANTSYTTKTPQHNGEFGHLSPLDINCGNSFINRWKLETDGTDIKVKYTCTTNRTSDASGCDTSTTSGDFGVAAKAGAMSSARVRCPANKALTQFKWTGDGTISYTCCPKPTSGSSSSAATTTTTNTTISETEDTIAAVTSCKPKAYTQGCYDGDILNQCVNHQTQSVCVQGRAGFDDDIPCCEWKP